MTVVLFGCIHPTNLYLYNISQFFPAVHISPTFSSAQNWDVYEKQTDILEAMLQSLVFTPWLVLISHNSTTSIEGKTWQTLSFINDSISSLFQEKKSPCFLFNEFSVTKQPTAESTIGTGTHMTIVWPVTWHSFNTSWNAHLNEDCLNLITKC